MLGTVEIYKDFNSKTQERVFHQSNLIVNGGAETICSLLTTPSGIVAGAAGSTDSSNFTIQALSLGKSSEAYRANGHYFPFSEKSYFAINDMYTTYVNSVSSDGIIRAVSENNENIAFSTSSYDPKRDPGVWPNPNDRQLEKFTDTAIDQVKGQYYYAGGDVLQGRAPSYGHNLNRIVSNTNPNLLSYTEPITQDSAGVYWTVVNIGASSLSGLNTGPEYGTQALLLSSTHNAVGRLTQNVPLSKTCFHHNVDHTYSVYVQLPQKNATSSITLNIRDTTAPNVGHSAKFITYDESVSSYISPVVSSLANGALAKVSPVVDKTGTPGWYRLQVRLQGLGDTAFVGTKMGDQVEARLTFTAPGNKPTTGGELHIWGTQLEESFGASRYQPVSGIERSFKTGGVAGDTFLGCYPHTSGTSFAILSDIKYLQNSTSNVLTSGTFPDTTDRTYFNSSSVRSMDQNGFIKAYFPSATKGGEQAWPYDITDPGSGLIVSADVNFSSTGEVSCITTIASADLGLANMFGGLFKLGLWTIDLPKTLADTDDLGNSKIAPSFPLTFNAGYNKLVYKLFAEKSLTKNMAAVNDDGSNAGWLKYSDLTLVWRLNFI
jgi:hypothetical protein